LLLLKRDLESQRFGLDSSATITDVMSLLKLWLQMAPQPILNTATLPIPPCDEWQHNPGDALRTFTSSLGPSEHGVLLVVADLIRRCARGNVGEIERGANSLAPLMRSAGINQDTKQGEYFGSMTLLLKLKS
jgi:hypothetical protein